MRSPPLATTTRWRPSWPAAPRPTCWCCSSDIDGLYTANPHTHPDAKLIPLVEEITPRRWLWLMVRGWRLGTGGMATKLRAARMVTGSGADMVIANGAHPELLYDIAAGKPVGTRFAGPARRI